MNDKIEWSFEAKQIVGITACVILATIIVVLLSIQLVDRIKSRKPKKKIAIKERIAAMKRPLNYSQPDEASPKTSEPKSAPSEPQKRQTYEKTEHNAEAPLERIKYRIQKVSKLVGVAEHFSSLSILDNFLNDDLRGVALAIAQKLSIRNPIINIKRVSEEKRLSDNTIAVADVQVSSNNEAVFGTPGFDYQTINIRVYPGAKDHPEKFTYVLAHELCHKILHSLDRGRVHDDLDERETDIAAALLGFSKSYGVAKKIEPGLGYLDANEGDYLVKRCDELLRGIKEKRAQSYQKYIALRQGNDDKVLFLKYLYQAKRLQGDDEWSVDYAMAADDYNKLLVCVNTISLNELKEYIKLCNYFKAKGDKRDRYNIEDLNSDDDGKFKKLADIISRVKLPDFDAANLLKKYQ